MNEAFRPPPSETLFVADLPQDVTKEEVEVPFKDFPGYKNVRTRQDKHGMVVTFVEFESIDSASGARESLSGVLRLRPTDPPVSIYFARHSYSGDAGDERGKRPREESGGDDRNVRSRAEVKCHACGGVGHFARDCPTSSGRPGGGDSRGPPRGGYSGGGDSRGPVNPGQPTSTLYVDNVPPDVTEREMSHIFRPFGGFQDVRHVPLKKTGNDAKTFLCFVEFASTEQAQAALQTLQGYVLDLKEPRNSLRIEFTKTMHKTQRSGGGMGGGMPPPSYSSGPPMGGHMGGGGMGGGYNGGGGGGYGPGPMGGMGGGMPSYGGPGGMPQMGGMGGGMPPMGGMGGGMPPMGYGQGGMPGYGRR